MLHDNSNRHLQNLVHTLPVQMPLARAAGRPHANRFLPHHGEPSLTSLLKFAAPVLVATKSWQLSKELNKHVSPEMPTPTNNPTAEGNSAIEMTYCRGACRRSNRQFAAVRPIT
jgi:hypothetical protein